MSRIKALRKRFSRLLARGRRRYDDRALRFAQQTIFDQADARRGDPIGLLAREVAVDYDKAPLSILATSNAETKLRSRSVMKEPWTVHWLEHAVAPDDVVYDIGANVGTYALLAALAHEHRIRVFAFEPGYNSFAALCRNVIHNGAERSVSPVNALLHREDGHTLFKYRSTESGAARHAVGEQALQAKTPKDVTEAVYEQVMVCLTLDSIVSRHGLPIPNHIKLDVDGSELAVLSGGDTVLSSSELRSVMVELDDREGSEAIIELLERHGLKLVRAFPKGGREPQSDAFFARDPEWLGAIMAISPGKDPRKAKTKKTRRVKKLSTAHQSERGRSRNATFPPLPCPGLNAGMAACVIFLLEGGIIVI